MTISALPHIELDASAFEEFLRARTGLTEACGIEERFNMVLENYAEFEAELLEQSLYHMMFDELEWSRLAQTIHVFNRRLNNLLSTCRLYLDQTPQALHRVFGASSEAASAMKRACSEEYDDVLAYRVMEAVRNYSQHNNLAVARFSVYNGEFPGYERELNHHMVIPSLDLAKLRSDSDFKQPILDELDAAGTQYTDIRMLVRKYVEALGRIHSRVQDLLSADLVEWDSLMVTLRARLDGKSVPFVAVVCMQAGGGPPRESLVADEVCDRRKALSKRNKYAKSYSRQVVSNFAGT